MGYSSSLLHLVVLLVVQGNRARSAYGNYGLSTPAPGCGGEPKIMGQAMYDAIQMFESPGFPKNYPNNADCTWIFESETLHDERAVEISFDNFETENCSDYLEIRDGKDGSGALLGRFCGRIDSSFSVVSRSKAMRVRFHSDSQRTYKGFSAQYMSVHSDRGGDIGVFPGRVFIMCGVGVLLAAVLITIGLCICTRRKKNNTMRLAHTGPQLLPAEETNCYVASREVNNVQSHLLYWSKYKEELGPPPCYSELV